jgi:hypothetical protein
MVFDESGDHGAAAEIDAPDVRAGEPADLLRGADGSDSVAANGDGLRDGEAVVRRDNLAVHEDQVGNGLGTERHGDSHRQEEGGDRRVRPRRVGGPRHARYCKPDPPGTPSRRSPKTFTSAGTFRLRRPLLVVSLSAHDHKPW